MQDKHLKVRLLSDLHLEFGKFKIPKLDDDSESVLVLAGDIHVGRRHRNWLERYLPRFRHVILVPGNHEYYNNEMTEIDEYWFEYDDKTPNFSYMVNHTLEIDDVVFYGSTMWSSYNEKDPLAMLTIRQRMTDYRAIHVKDNAWSPQRTVTPDDLYEKHCDASKFFMDNIPKKEDGTEKKHVVITHHLPSFQSIDAKYINQTTLNHAYYTDMEYLMADYSIDYWLHGHTHASKRYKCFDTEVVCNPRGYCPNDLNRDFNPILTLYI